MTGNEALVYESIIRDMSEGVITIGLNGVIESINPAAEEILGKKREDVLGKRYARTFLTDRENDAFNQAVLDAMYNPQVKHKKIVPYRQGDETKQLYMVTSFLFHGSDKVATIVVFDNITELAALKVRYAQDIATLLDSLVKALAIAIDERSPYNANHTRKMVKMAEDFLNWQQDHGNPWQYDEDRRRAFIMSVGLHDIGKLSVPLEIMDKATRLGPQLETIQERFTKLKLLKRIALLEGAITEDAYREFLAKTEETLAFISEVNVMGFLPDRELEKVQSLSSVTFENENGVTERLLTDEEIVMLSIRKGTLTSKERSIMQGHAMSTSNILNQVCFPEGFADVPVWASRHHELINSTGYPKGLSAQNIPRESRLLTILDIFEALTAKDRPYKPPIPIEKAWAILDNMVQDGCIDGELLAAFKESRVWESVLEPLASGQDRQ